MKIIITGGHLSPLLSVLDELPKETKVLVLGRKKFLEGDKAISLEYQTLKDRNIPFVPIISGRLQRKLTTYTFFSLFKFPIGFFQSLFILKEFRPDIVLSFGGYISLPVVISSFLLRIPVVIHEQTMGAGLANKIASKFAKKICISWESSAKFFPKSKTVLTGNPIRKFKIHPFDKLRARISNEKIPLIYITGGSSGSHAINILAETILEELLSRYKIIHQTGDAREFGDFERLKNLKEKLSEKLRSRYYLTKFVDPEDAGRVLKDSDLVISRSGMNTVTELIYFTKPSLLIPLPYSQGNEQVENARLLKDIGISEIAFQKDLTSQKLLDIINQMIKDIKNYKHESKELIKENAAKKIIEICLKES